MDEGSFGKRGNVGPDYHNSPHISPHILRYFSILRYDTFDAHSRRGASGYRSPEDHVLKSRGSVEVVPREVYFSGRSAIDINMLVLSSG